MKAKKLLIWMFVIQGLVFLLLLFKAPDAHGCLAIVTGELDRGIMNSASATFTNDEIKKIYEYVSLGDVLIKAQGNLCIGVMFLNLICTSIVLFVNRDKSQKQVDGQK